MANVDKAYYQQAAYEVAQGQLDQALWIKVRADNPHSDDKAIQALYVQARARELALEHGRDIITRIGTGAANKTRDVIRDIQETVRWALKWSLLYVPLMVGMIGWALHTDEQNQYARLATQIDALDQAAFQNNAETYQRTLSIAKQTCNDLDESKQKALNIFRNGEKEDAAAQRCARLNDIDMSLSIHLARVSQGQPDITPFQLPTLEKL